MGLLALGALAAGALPIPKVTHVVDHFLEPTFAESALYEREPSDGLIGLGLLLGAGAGLVGIALAYLIWVRRPQIALRARQSLAPLHRLLVTKWYFDELIDLLVVRPALWFGSFARQTFERVFVEGVLVDGTTNVVRAGSTAVRAAQTGFVRYYAALVLVGMVLVGFYFLVEA